MTPKEKAEELYKKMLGNDSSTHPKVFGEAKKCALIAVNEIIKELTSNDVYADYWYAVEIELKKI